MVAGTAGAGNVDRDDRQGGGKGRVDRRVLDQQARAGGGERATPPSEGRAGRAGAARARGAWAVGATDSGGAGAEPVGGAVLAAPVWARDPQRRHAPWP